MALSKRVVNGATVIAVSGDVDLQSSPVIRQQLLACFDTTNHVIVDLAGVTYMDSSGVASLVEALQLAHEKSGTLALVGVSAALMRVLSLARLDHVFSIHPTLAAVAAEAASQPTTARRE